MATPTEKGWVAVRERPDSRAATDALLTGLRAGGYRPAAWQRFAREATARSVEQARRLPRALAEVTALHALFWAVARRQSSGQADGNSRWLTASWALSASHLGMLGDRRSIGLPGVLTLTRSCLPVVGRPLGRWLGVVAGATDLADGRLARRLDHATHFGAAADSLADAACWTALLLREEPDRRVRRAALAAWAVPVVAVTGLSVARGRTVDAPRPAVVRPAAALQALVAARHLLRRPSPSRRGGTVRVGAK